MSYRISRAMGYGMPWTRFEELCKLTPDADYGLSEALRDCFHGLTDEQMTVPEDVSSDLFDGPRPSIIERRLLSTTFTSFGKDGFVLGHPNDLYDSISIDDETSHVIFFPNLYYAAKWCRFDDDLDHAFEAWCRDPDASDSGKRGQQAEPRDFVVYTGYGHYPWNGDLMLADGTPVPWERFCIVEQHPEWLPAVPSEIRWYLTTLGVLDDAGINELRPLIAQWWG